MSNQLGFTQIYTPKQGGRVFTAMDTSGENCTSDGIRFNIANEHTLVDRESTWIFTLNNNPVDCTDKPWAPKIGSHGDADQASGLYEASVPYTGGFKSMRTEGPFPHFHPCSKFIIGGKIYYVNLDKVSWTSVTGSCIISSTL